jgi:putative ABC transport system permease protein
MANFTIKGTVKFGSEAMDRGSILIDIKDVRFALDMQDAVGEILGYFPGKIYNDVQARDLTEAFNRNYSKEDDEFSPLMAPLSAQNDLESLLKYMDSMSAIAVTVFIFAMSLVLWNTGLIGGLRRYGEVGVRLAIGENKGRVYRSMLAESILIGIFGSIIGTLIGLGISYLLQVYGLDFSSMMKNVTMMIPSTYRAQVTREAYYIGFFPGLVSTVLGTSLSGIGIYKRKTAQLFKELEV